MTKQIAQNIQTVYELTDAYLVFKTYNIMRKLHHISTTECIIYTCSIVWKKI